MTTTEITTAHRAGTCVRATDGTHCHCTAAYYAASTGRTAAPCQLCTPADPAPITAADIPAVTGRGAVHYSGGEDFTIRTTPAGNVKRHTGRHYAACGAVRGATLRTTTAPVNCEKCLAATELHVTRWAGAVAADAQWQATYGIPA